MEVEFVNVYLHVDIFSWVLLFRILTDYWSFENNIPLKYKAHQKSSLYATQASFPVTKTATSFVLIKLRYQQENKQKMERKENWCPHYYIVSYFCRLQNYTFKSKEPESNCLLRQKNTTEIILIHKGTKMVKDLEGKFRLQTMNLKNLLNFLRCTSQDAALFKALARVGRFWSNKWHMILQKKLRQKVQSKYQI